MSYIGQGLPADTFQGFTTDSFTGDGSATTFTLSKEPFSEDTLIVVINNVIQQPGTNFTVSGTTLTIVGTAVANGDPIYAIHMGGPLPIGEVNKLDLNGGSDQLILDADADTTISADTDDQIDIKIGGSDIFQMTASKLDLNGKELVLDADADTSITSDTDDQIDIRIGGADDFAFKANNFEVQSGSTIDMNGQELILDADGDTSITADTDDKIDFKCSGLDTIQMNKFGQIKTIRESATTFGGSINFTHQRNTTASPNIVSSGDTIGGLISAAYDGNEYLDGPRILFQVDGTPADDDMPTRIVFQTTQDGTAGTLAEAMRIDDIGAGMLGKTSLDVNVEGIELRGLPAHTLIATCADANTALYVARNSNDGQMVAFYAQGYLEGTISVSGSTVSYNAFTGGHWSRLADNSKPTILRGTIMETLDEMCDWYQAVADVPESKDDNGNVIPAHQIKENIALPEGKSVGDAVTFTYYFNGKEYTGKYEKDTDIKHVKCKISDTADSNKVYGVFNHWDDADDGSDGDVNDMNIAQVGTFVIRVNKDVTVEAGDLLVSNGDGTAKVQDDDIMRSKTVAKVNSNIKVETYSDGSYTVPCTLHC